MALPPGFRFHPTDEELVAYYLRRKVGGRGIEFNVITEIDLYKQEPWDLPDKSLFNCGDLEWYFFSPRDKKYPNGLRTNRATGAGYWKATGKDRNVKKKGGTIGMKKTLVFYIGRAPHGERTDWVMHEYRLNEEECEKIQAAQDLFVLCRVFKKSGVGPRSGDDRGPQTYVDDDIDREECGSLAEALKKALDQGSASTSAIVPVRVETPTVAPVSPPSLALEDSAQKGDSFSMSRSVIAPAPEEKPEVAPIDSRPVSVPSLSVEDYAPDGEAGDADDLSTAVVPFTGYILDEPTFDESGDVEFWDCIPSLAAELDLANPAGGSLLELSSEFYGGWQGDRSANTPSGMLWSSDPTRIVQQQDESIAGAGLLDTMQLELLGTDDVLPPLVEELESNNPPNHSEACGLASNCSENENQMLRGRSGPARARSRAARRLPTSEEAQQSARSSDDSITRHESTPQQRMSSMNFSSPEVPFQGEDSASLNVMWPAPQGSASINFDTKQLPSSSVPTPSASTTGYGISGVPEDSLFSFQDSFFDFPEEDEFNAGLEHDDNGFSFAVLGESVGEQGSSEVSETPSTDESVKPSKSPVSEGPPSFSSSTQEGPSEKTRPSPTKPLTGLMKLLGSLPVLPASAAECPPDVMPVHANGEPGSTYDSIHLSAVTVTCTSSVDGAQNVQAAVIDCRLHGYARGVYQQVVSASSWQAIPDEKAGTKQTSDTQKPLCANCDTAASSGVLQRRVARGSNSGFVFVFGLGAVSALCWYVVLRGTWRLASHVLSSAF